MIITRVGQSDPDDDMLGDSIREVMGKGKRTSADCVMAILADPHYSGTKASDWKRTSKRKDSAGCQVRVFVNRSTHQTVEVTERPSGMEIKGTNPGAGLKGQGTQPQPTGYNGIMLAPPHTSEYEGGEEWSGRVIFDRAVDSEEDNEVAFTCGPEEKDGSLDDSDDGGCRDKLEAIFADFPDKMIESAENYHQIQPHAGQNKTALWQVIRGRLLAAGAVPEGFPSSNATQQSQAPHGAGGVNAPIYYHAAQITPDNAEEFGGEDNIGNWLMTLTTKQYWDTHHCQIDNTPPWMKAILDSVPFPAEEMENTYIIDGATLLKVMADQRFHAHPGFAQFMASAGSGP